MRALLLMGSGVWIATMVSATGLPYPVRARDADWVAPAAQSARTNPLADRPETAAGGRKLFHQRCTPCHGEDARGTRRGPDLTAAAVQRQSDGALFWKITSGNTRTGMPTFSFLPDLQRWQLLLHLRSHAGGAVRDVR